MKVTIHFDESTLIVLRSRVEWVKLGCVLTPAHFAVYFAALLSCTFRSVSNDLRGELKKKNESRKKRINRHRQHSAATEPPLCQVLTTDCHFFPELPSVSDVEPHQPRGAHPQAVCWIFDGDIERAGRTAPVISTRQWSLDKATQACPTPNGNLPAWISAQVQSSHWICSYFHLLSRWRNRYVSSAATAFWQSKEKGI